MSSELSVLHHHDPVSILASDTDKSCFNKYDPEMHLVGGLH